MGRASPRVAVVDYGAGNLRSVAKALVRSDAEPFQTFAARREDWVVEDRFLYPGAIQYFGPPEVSDRPPRTVLLNRGAKG